MFAEVVRDPASDRIEDSEALFDSLANRAAWPSSPAVWAAGDAAFLDAEPEDSGIAGTTHVGGAGNSVDVGSLDYSGLMDRLVGLVAERNRVEGEYLAALGELSSRYGTQAAAYELRDKTRMNGPQARAESRLAHDLAQHGFGETVESMRRGEIHMSHAKVIARESPKPHRRDEESFLGLSRAHPSDTIARHTLAVESQQVYDDLAAEAAARNLDPVDAELALQRHQRRVSLRCGDDGMWDLRGRFDFMTGRRLSIALQAAIRSLRHRHSTAHCAARSGDGAGAPGSGEGVEAQPTTAQLAADALSELVCGGPASQRSGTNLLIIADYDVVNDRLANPRLDDGTPISARMLADHAADANVLPAVFKADWSELALGRTRNASDAQRLVLAARDGGCIGCELTFEHTESHHIDHHQNGGLTEIPNLASLCRPCHLSLHQHGRRIHTPPDGKPGLQPPDGNGPPPTTDPAPTPARSP